MQDRYTGDLGDFGKYALLNALSGGDCRDGDRALRLGVHWYRVPDEDHRNDGKFTGYLERSPANDARFRACDPGLYNALAAIVKSRRRNLEAVERSAILPRGTCFFSRPLTFAGKPPRRAARAEHRARWHAEALAHLSGAEIVFLDPDNGLECAVAPTASAGPKFAMLGEAAAFSARGQSVVIYHHIGRRGSAIDQIGRQLQRLAAACPGATAPFALRWHRGTARAYLIVPAPVHDRILRRRAAVLLQPPWSTHWSDPCA